MEVSSELPGLVGPQSAAEHHHASSIHNERMLDRCKVLSSFISLFIYPQQFIPMRLTEDERVLLNILENALDVSEYTDTVDVFARKPKSDRIIAGLVDILSISSGLMVSNNLSKGEGLMKTNSLGLYLFFTDLIYCS